MHLSSERNPNSYSLPIKLTWQILRSRGVALVVSVILTVAHGETFNAIFTVAAAPGAV